MLLREIKDLMQKYTMFMDWKTQYCYDMNSPQIDLCSQHNPNQNSNRLFAETDKLIIKFIWKCRGPREAIFKKKNHLSFG